MSYGRQGREGAAGASHLEGYSRIMNNQPSTTLRVFRRLKPRCRSYAPESRSTIPTRDEDIYTDVPICSQQEYTNYTRNSFQTTLSSYSMALMWCHQLATTQHVRLLIRSWHAVHLFAQCSPVVRL
jgi:hypothetical protein